MKRAGISSAFENFLQNNRKCTRKPSNILQQLHNRNSDEQIIASQKELFFHGKVLSYQSSWQYLNIFQSNNVCCIRQLYVSIKITSLLDREEGYVIGKQLLEVRNYFEDPVESFALGICLCNAST